MSDVISQTNLFGEVSTDKLVVSRDLLTSQLTKTIGSYKLEDIARLLTNDFDEIINYSRLSNGESTCQKMSLLFNPHRLDTKTKSSTASIYQAMKTESFISGLSRASIWKGNKVSELLYQVIQLGINGIQYVNEFPPHIARDIAKEYKLDANSKVLDPCAGWGGRMIGLSVVVNRYDCFEPSTKTYDGLNKLALFLNCLSPDFKASVYNLPFEESSLMQGYYDFAITSPPYYDTEEYSSEPTNSLNKFKTFDCWSEGFYIPLIHKTIKALKPGKPFILNIGSRQYPLNEILNGLSGSYSIIQKGNYLSGNAGLGRSGEGEMFYEIRERV